jgi:hypothetical protein
LLVGPLKTERLAQVIVDKIKAKYLVKSKLKRETGYGYWGFFSNQKIPKLVAWYENTGLNTDQYGSTFGGKTKKEMTGTMVAFVADTNYFEPSEKQFMQNFRVDDLEQLLKNYLMKV